MNQPVLTTTLLTGSAMRPQGGALFTAQRVTELLAPPTVDMANIAMTGIAFCSSLAKMG